MSTKELGEETNVVENCQSAYADGLDVKSVWKAYTLPPRKYTNQGTKLTNMFGCIGYPTFGFFFRLLYTSRLTNETFTKKTHIR